MFEINGQKYDLNYLEYKVSMFSTGQTVHRLQNNLNLIRGFMNNKTINPKTRNEILLKSVNEINILTKKAERKSS